MCYGSKKRIHLIWNLKLIEEIEHYKLQLNVDVYNESLIYRICHPLFYVIGNKFNEENVCQFFKLSKYY